MVSKALWLRNIYFDKVRENVMESEQISGPALSAKHVKFYL